MIDLSKKTRDELEVKLKEMMISEETTIKKEALDQAIRIHSLFIGDKVSPENIVKTAQYFEEFLKTRE